MELVRILLATHFFAPGHLGGTEVLTHGLARSLGAAGHSVEVVCAEDWENAPGYRIRATRDSVDGVVVNRLRFNWQKAPDVFRYLYDNPEVEKYVFDLVGRSRPDVLHITSCYSLSGSLISAARRRGVPVVLTATDFWFLCARNTLLKPDGSLCSGPEHPWKCAQCLLANSKAYRWPRRLLSERSVGAILQGLARFPMVTNRRGFRGMLGDWQDRFRFLAQALTQVDRIVTASQFLRALFIRYGVSPSRIQRSAYGLDTEWATSWQTKKPSTQLRAAFIGQILPAKGPDLLVKAIRSLPADAPIEVRIYGDLSKTPRYSETLLAQAQGDQRISFPGIFDNSQMGRVLSEIDVLVVPSIWYDFPLVIPSAHATKTPVVATNLPGMNELVTHELDGLLFERNRWEDLASSIRRLIDEPGLLDRLRAHTPPLKTLEEYAAESVAVYASLARRYADSRPAADSPGHLIRAHRAGEMRG